MSLESVNQCLQREWLSYLPPEELQDILVYPNIEDNHNPLIGAMPAGEGKKVVMNYKVKAKGQEEKKNMIMMIIIGFILVAGF